MNNKGFINSLEKNREIHMYLESDLYTIHLKSYYNKNDSNEKFDNLIDLLK